jgi:hypothetical protein
MGEKRVAEVDEANAAVEDLARNPWRVVEVFSIEATRSLAASAAS